LGNDVSGGAAAVIDATADIDNCTISGNSAWGSPWGGGWGGGVVVTSTLDWGGHGATVDISNSTISHNYSRAHSATGIRAYLESGSGVVTVVLRNTIIAENEHWGYPTYEFWNCEFQTPAFLDSLGFNLADDTSCDLTQPSDLVVDDVMLGCLEDGVPMPYCTPLPGSPAIDTGDDTNCPATDQLGHVRPWDGDSDGFANCDRGAIEVRSPFFFDGFESGDTSAWSAVVP
jgi:hypothetical protein